jgi:hypothetical protein
LLFSLVNQSSSTPCHQYRSEQDLPEGSDVVAEAELVVVAKDGSDSVVEVESDAIVEDEPDSAVD